MSVPVSALNAHQIREGVHTAYSTVAENPKGEHPFPVGRAFAEQLGYPPELLDRLPQPAVEAFAGVSNVSLLADIPPGAAVLDLGCGAGLDSLIAATRTGPAGSVTGVDFSEAMLLRARQSAAEAGLSNVAFEHSLAESLPLEAASVDVGLVNGIFNLNLVREPILAELARVMRPGGTVYAAEIVLREPLPEHERQNVTNWFA
jgi:SAM-dependent methyltransferase